RRHLGSGPRRSRRPADRGPRPRRPRLRRHRDGAPSVPRRHHRPHPMTPQEEPLTMTTDRPAVLFVCVKNGGKSQMAAALMRHHAAGAVEVLSAGTHPGSAINARSAEAVAEVGADMASAVPQPVTPELLRRVDQVIVIGGDAVIDPVEGMRAPVTTWRTRSVLRSPSRCAGTRVSPL